MPSFSKKTVREPRKVKWTEACWVRWVDGLPTFGGRIQGMKYVIIARNVEDVEHFWQINALSDRSLAKQQARYAYKDLKDLRLGRVVAVEVWKKGECVYRFPKEKV